MMLYYLFVYIDWYKQKMAREEISTGKPGIAQQRKGCNARFDKG